VTTEILFFLNPQQPDALHPCQRPYALASSSYKKQMTQKKFSLSLSLSLSLFNITLNQPTSSRNHYFKAKAFVAMARHGKDKRRYGSYLSLSPSLYKKA